MELSLPLGVSGGDGTRILFGNQIGTLLVLLNIVTGTIVLIIIMKVEYKGEDVPLRKTT